MPTRRNYTDHPQHGHPTSGDWQAQLNFARFSHSLFFIFFLLPSLPMTLNIHSIHGYFRSTLVRLFLTTSKMTTRDSSSTEATKLGGRRSTVGKKKQ